MASFLDNLRNGARGAERVAEQMERLAWRVHQKARPLNEIGWRLEGILKRVQAFTDRYEDPGRRRPRRSWR